ncbi:bifunctional hydroxymethylpyrimidine kinase/phosphomethylpyrimidine kinase [Candidatus Contubernalis alkalaceticus]|uniref:bifunctional hydroxymethylpyrimidine kinase/phosphomethylpyrimidine kinase n=1 Tax=Candidatus Contubernalis alkaliaceticus TaxID=338645 RepID=UPI0029620DA8|nr:bifunctional hydroxymethylpyrimidine kinase/phosphomethylpyrimidine kinase [Candidatus Contubernalis alkalaceticus]UNC92384.1 bifunctional hydroxymethylpyrimidine kinase/phosphomethylpyrimidine kinase [Candidatus Contubernalis alkalaceticus]
MKKVLTIAGSDSGGGAGIQADLKTFAALGLHGLSAITALTAQNSLGVMGIRETPGDFVEAQLEAVLKDFKVSALKTGMLANNEIIQTVSNIINKYQLKNLVVDPVMVAQSGDPLLKSQAVKILKEKLLPLSLIITPNIDEAEILADMEINDMEGVRKAAKIIKEYGPEYVIIKGGHLTHQNKAIDILYDGKDIHSFEAPLVDTKNTHGTGCTFSAALASYLALEYDVLKAVEKSKYFITTAIKYSYKPGLGYGPVQPLAEILNEREKTEILENLNKALLILKSVPITPLIPEVQSNLVMALPKASSIDEVAAFPGRIIKLGNKITTLAEPQFNCSRWMSRVILAVTKNNFAWRSTMNIKYSTDIIKTVRKAGFIVESFKREEEPPNLALDSQYENAEWGTDTVLRGTGFVPDAIYDKGGFGKEGMIRIFGRDALDVAHKVSIIAENYFKFKQNEDLQ